MLRSSGFDAVVYTRSRQFLADFPNLHLDLVVLDLAMPECDGFEVLRVLRSELLSPVPVLVLSAQVKRAQLQELERSGVVQVLRKPVHVDELIARVTTGVSAPDPVDGAAVSAADSAPATVQHAARIPPQR